MGKSYGQVAFETFEENNPNWPWDQESKTLKADWERTAAAVIAAYVAREGQPRPTDDHALRIKELEEERKRLHDDINNRVERELKKLREVAFLKNRIDELEAALLARPADDHALLQAAALLWPFNPANDEIGATVALTKARALLAQIRGGRAEG
jgi:hypothetical protein